MGKTTKTKLAKASADLARAVRELERWDGGARGHNARRDAVLAALRAARAAVDAEQPRARQRAAKPRRTTVEVRRAMRADGWQHVTTFSAGHHKIRGGTARKAGGLWWVRAWELEVLSETDEDTLRRAKRSRTERDAVLAEIALRRLG